MEESRLKQRLVGAVVLVALAVIFIPMLLSGGRDMEMPVFGSNVPDRSAEIRNIKHIDIAEMKIRELLRGIAGASVVACTAQRA